MGLASNPKLRGYQFVNPPKPLEVNWDKQNTVHTLADGSTREYVKGYKIMAKLKWNQGWVRNEDFSALFTMANDNSDLTFVPRPDVPAGETATFTVRWTNSVDFVWHKGQQNTWKGTINLMGVGITATATPLGI